MRSTIRYFTIEKHTHTHKKKKEEGRAAEKKVADEKKKKRNVKQP